MDRNEMLKSRLARFLRERKGLLDELVEPGEQLIVIISFDVYRPPAGGFEESDKQLEQKGIMMHTDSRQLQLNQLHRDVLTELNQWASNEKLLKGAESVCADIMIALSQKAPAGTYIVRSVGDPIPKVIGCVLGGDS